MSEFTKKQAIDKVIAIAMAEVGYLEKKSEKDLYDKTKNYGTNNYTKYNYEMHKIYPATMDYPAYWCDAFVDWCFYKAFGVANAKKVLAGSFDDYTVRSVALYKSKNAYHKTPQVGDQIFLRYGGRVSHTGLVYKVDKTYVYTVEGNTSASNGVVRNGDGVALKKYYLTYNAIDGYGRPLYEMLEDKAKKNGIVNEQVIPKKPEPKKPAPKAPTKVEIPKATLRPWHNTNMGQIKLLQLALNKAIGTNLQGIGSYGPKTIDAVKAFQKKYGLTVDGVYGPSTEAKLREVLK